MSSRIITSLLTKRVLLLFVGIVIGYASLSTFNTPKVQAAPPTATQTLTQRCTKRQFFGLVPWWQYLGRELDDGSYGHPCDVRCFNLIEKTSGSNKCRQTKSDIPLVLLAVVDDLLRIAGMVTIGYVLYGAFQFVASQGDPEGTARAQTTIINSLVGLALATTAVTIVSFLGKKLGG